MKSIGYRDKGDPRGIIHRYYIEDYTLFRHKRLQRTIEALERLHGVGNIVIYLIKGNKYRPIIERSFS